MDLEWYEFEVVGDYSEYEFNSIGAKGIIKKSVKFTPFKAGNAIFINLSFGDKDSKTGKVDDGVITNNGDPEKVLATIAFIVILYLDLHPDALIYAEGRTPARTRMYQMSINRNSKEIRKKVSIYGFTEDNELQPFKRKINYTAFLITKKTF